MKKALTIFKTVIILAVALASFITWFYVMFWAERYLGDVAFIACLVIFIAAAFVQLAFHLIYNYLKSQEK